MDFDEEIKKEIELKRLLLDNELDYWIGNPVVQIIHGQLILDSPFSAANPTQKQTSNKYSNDTVDTAANKDSDKKENDDDDEEDSEETEEAKSQIEEEKETSKKNVESQLTLSASLEELIAARRSLILTNKSAFEYTALVCLGIENSKSPVEVCEYIKEQAFSNGIVEIRVIKTQSNITYGMILYFLSSESCLSYFDKHFGQRFNTIEEDICILRPINHITFNLDALDIKNEEQTLLFSRHSSKGSTTSDSSSTTTTTTTPVLTGSTTQSIVQQLHSTSASSNNHPIAAASALSLVYNVNKSAEVPQNLNCAICQEPLLSNKENEEKSSGDINSSNGSSNGSIGSHNNIPSIANTNVAQLISKSSTATSDHFNSLLSVMCGHYFHSDCLSQWQDSICPLCRYQQQPPKLSYCEVCRSSEALWMCLVCGSINCGLEFMEESHVRLHFAASKHTYSMEIESKFVYDHASDSFVHRLMQNLADGKIVEHEMIPSSNSSAANHAQGSSSPRNEKIAKGKGKNSDLLKEYEKQMSTSLEAQRKYFQSKMADVNRCHTKNVQELNSQKKCLLEQIEREKALIAEEENALTATEERFEQTRKDFLELNTRKNTLAAEEAALSSQYSLLEKQEQLIEEQQQSRLQAIQAEIASKILEIKDMETHLKNKKKIQESGEDMSKSALLLLGGGGANHKQKKNKKK